MIKIDSSSLTATSCPAKKILTQKVIHPGLLHKINPYNDGASVLELNYDNWSSTKVGQKVLIELPDESTETLIVDRIEMEKGRRFLSAHIDGQSTDYRMNISESNGQLSGKFLTPRSDLLIEQHSNELWLVDPKMAGLNELDAQQDDALASPRPFSSLGISTGDMSTKMGTTGGAADMSNPTIIDIMILYTQGMVNRLGVDGTLNRINYLVNAGNQAFFDSHIAIKLRVVHTKLVQYPDTKTIDDTLTDMTYSAGSIPSIADVPALRNQYGADLVMMVRNFSESPSNTVCGLAWIAGSSSLESLGYATIHDGTNNGAYCSDYTFVHELSHNMGSIHDRVSENQSTGAKNGIYSYSFGYGVYGQFATVMAYAKNYNTTRIGKFSNPELSTCGSGVPCGVSESATNSSNNALSLNNRRIYVSQYRDTKVPLPTPTPSPSSTTTPKPTVNPLATPNNDSQCDK